jgi:bifunctional non-homologous end joining protein LigD
MAKDPLREYNRKRDFNLTQEPSGKKLSRIKSKKLIFVVQEHHARTLHYDFRLELEGVLKSWAVPKGPSFDPADKRLAVQTEDHPIEYAKFKGTIPEGEYGAGEVFIWDKGTWEPEDDDPIAALHKGHLKFKLKGKKLKGSFVLVRTHYKGDESGRHWLLIKNHDEIREHRPKKPSNKKAHTRGTDPWPGFIPPQLPRLMTQVPEDSGEWVHELKFDGYRMQGHLKNGVGNYYSRNALKWSNKFPHLLNALEQLPVSDAIFDGEIVALDEKGRSHFQKLQNSLRAKDDVSLRYYVFDVLYLNGKDLRSLPLLERKQTLKEILKEAPFQIIYSEHFTENASDFYRVSCEHELEGIISKLADSPYRSGRSDLWIKAKCSFRQEFVIGGWTGPRGGRPGFGALLLGIYENDSFRYVGRVGSGFDTETLEFIKSELSSMEIKESPFDVSSPHGKSIHWVTPKKVCEVSFGNWTKEGILRNPVFQGLREDKAPKDIGIERAQKNIRKKQLLSVREISSPEKILFKKERITKQQVSEFYQAIAHIMLPYMKMRPLSLVRCPNGSEGTCFFQKHISGQIPDSFHTFPIKEENGEGIYLAIDSAQGLQELVQLNAFEIHAWNCQKDNYLRPDQIVMDFDPGPEVPWNEVVDAAFEVKDMLEDLELKSFVKLTGGKGLHVHIPVAPFYDWEQVKSFARSIALELVARNPKKYTTNMSKKIRKGKIFVDYLRNGFGATAVVPYSLRARPLSAVALPLDWKELRRVKNPQDFTMGKALKKIKLRKKDPWEGMLKLRQKISILKPVAKERIKSRAA